MAVAPYTGLSFLSHLHVARPEHPRERKGPDPNGMQGHTRALLAISVPSSPVLLHPFWSVRVFAECGDLYASACLSVCTMCASNYSAENTPHSLGPVLRRRSAVSGRGGRRGKREWFCWTWGLSQLKLLLLRVKLESTRGWNGFVLVEGRPGRAKEKHSGFTAGGERGGWEQPFILSFMSRHKLHRLHSLVGVCVCVCVNVGSSIFLNTGKINLV